jgi:hypothetical protein
VKALILFLLLNVFAATLGSAALQNDFVDSTLNVQKIKISVIDSEQANSLFKKFASNEKIAFKYPIDGCYARATQMGEIADYDQIQTGRVYAEGLLQVKTDSAKYPFVKWAWHVAPVVYVRQPSGFDQLMVFDPSLFSKPVTVAEWVVKMSADGKQKPRIDKIYYGSRFQYYKKGYERSRDSWGKEILNAAKSTAEKYRPLQDMTSTATAPSNAETTKGAQ